MLFLVWVNTNSRCFLKNKLGTYEAENRVNLKMKANDKIKELKLFDNGFKLDISSYSHMNIRMSTKGKRPLRSLTPSDKIHAIQRIHDGESKASVARDIGVPESTLRGWCKNEDKLRFMSRQTDKITSDSVADKLGPSASIIRGPPEKRQKVDNGSIPFNYSGKSKYDEMPYKQSSRDGLGYSTSKGLSELGFNGLSSDYLHYSGAVKNKIFGDDILRQADRAGTSLSPLTSLSHLTGLSSLAQSPLAINFNELSSNLNLLAQINPGLAAMSGLNGLAATVSTLRTVKTKHQSLLQSPRSEGADRQQGLSVKNWAKQKPVSPTLSGLNLCQTEEKSKTKCPSPSLAPSMGNSTSPLQMPPDDSLLYWLKSQQTILGMNNLYPPTPSIEQSSPPMGPTPQRMEKLHINSTLNVCTPLTSSTPAFSFDDKNTAWLQWCKALGASLNSLVPAAAAAAVLHSTPMQIPQTPTSNGATTVNIETSISTSDISNQKTQMENILFTQLTKSVECPSANNSSVISNTQCKSVESMISSNRPEDLSSRKLETGLEPTLAAPSPPNLSMSPSSNTLRCLVPTPVHSPRELSTAGTSNSPLHGEEMPNTTSNMADCKIVLDNLLYKINNSPSAVLLSKATSSTSFDGLDADEFSEESNASYKNETHQSSCDDNGSENRGNERNEEHLKIAELNKDESDSEAIQYGEKFLKWLESCSNPRITATHLMQLRFLLSALRPNSEESCIENGHKTNAGGCTEYLVDLEDSNYLNKVRRRK